MKEGDDYYLERGYRVFTRDFHYARGFCCKNSCRHCPYDKKNMKREKEFLFTDMDGVLCDFEAGVHKMFPDSRGVSEVRWKEYVDIAQATHGFWKNIPPMEGAIEAYKKLNEKFDFYILSAPSWPDPHSYSEKREWVEEYLGNIAEKKLILTHHKGMFSGRALIDDRTKYNVADFKG